MRSDLHLDISEIAAFGNGPRSEQCDETLRHLLKCGDCRSLLPVPRTKEFWRAILEDRTQAQDSDKKFSLLIWGTSSVRSMGRLLSIPKPARTVVAAAVLIFSVLGFSLLFFVNRTSQANDGTIAELIEPPFDEVLSHTPDMREDQVDSTYVSGSRSNQDARASSISALVDSRANPKPRVAERKTVIRNRTASTGKRAATRGSGPACGEASPIGFEIFATASGTQLKWRRVPAAISYAVYLSDLDERLVDKYETEKETTYLTTAKLDAESSYKWKFVVALKGDRTMLATSQTFRPKDLESGRGHNIPIRAMATASIRCTEVK